MQDRDLHCDLSRRSDGSASLLSDRIILWEFLCLTVFDVCDFSVAHVEDAVGYLCGLGIVSDHQHGLVELAGGGAEHLEDGVGVFGVEVAGGLVGEDDRGAGNEGTGDGYTLLLAAGELVGTVLEATVDSEEVSEVVEEGLVEGAFGTGAEVGDVVGDLDVAHGGEGGQEVETLEDEADAGAAHFGAFGVGELGEVGAVDGDVTGGGGGEAAEDVKEGGFSGAGGADDGDELARGDFEVYVAEGGYFEMIGFMVWD
jgi:hypothetical protein